MFKEMNKSADLRNNEENQFKKFDFVLYGTYCYKINKKNRGRVGGVFKLWLDKG